MYVIVQIILVNMLVYYVDGFLYRINLICLPKPSIRKVVTNLVGRYVGRWCNISSENSLYQNMIHMAVHIYVCMFWKKTVNTEGTVL